jgi:hypothetical protein
MYRREAKTSFLATLAILLSTGVAFGQTTLATPEPAPSTNVSVRQANVTIVPKQISGIADVVGKPVTGPAKQQIERIVSAQLTALARGDAQSAFANLSPATQAYFVGPGDFLTMVGQEAAPILRTRSFSFVGTEMQGGLALQQVVLTDDQGRNWLAKFQVQQQANGEWRVKSCVVGRVKGVLA